jgi:hypothetical protein
VGESSDVSLTENEACSSTCKRSSAEWIVKSPSVGSQIADLPKFEPFDAGQATDALRLR